MKRIILAAVAAISLSACTDPYTGRTDYARSALLGAGIGAAGGLLGGAIADRPAYGYGYYPRRSLGNGYGGYGPVPPRYYGGWGW